MQKFNQKGFKTASAHTFGKHFAALHGNVQAYACVIYLSKAPSHGPYLSKRGPHKGSPSRSGQADPYLLAAKFLTCCSFSPL